ncbi:MAG: hypothetical protein U0531_08305 [Dehalococcoidia bacterium]
MRDRVGVESPAQGRAATMQEPTYDLSAAADAVRADERAAIQRLARGVAAQAARAAGYRDAAAVSIDFIDILRGLRRPRRRTGPVPPRGLNQSPPVEVMRPAGRNRRRDERLPLHGGRWSAPAGGGARKGFHRSGLGRRPDGDTAGAAQQSGMEDNTMPHRPTAALGFSPASPSPAAAWWRSW